MDNKNRRVVLSISFPAWLAVLLREKSKNAGKTVSDYIKDMILEKFSKSYDRRK